MYALLPNKSSALIMDRTTTPIEPGQLTLHRHALKLETDNFFLDLEFINKQGEWVIGC